MSLSISRRSSFLNILKYRRLYSTSAVSIEDEYTSTPEYPEILDTSSTQMKKRETLAYYETIKAVKTVEEKQIKLNMPKYYGFKCFELHEEAVPYNNLDLTRYFTKTHLIVNNQLPVIYPTTDKIDFESLLREVEEILVLAHGYRKSTSVNGTSLTPKESENLMSSIICQQIHRAILLNLQANYSHLHETQVDIDPRVECSWFVGGIPSNFEYKHNATELKDKAVHYIGTPSLTIRSKIPLAPLMTMDEVKRANFTVPKWEYQPQSFGIFTNYRRIVNIPGFWPGDPHHFGLLGYHHRGHILERKHIDSEDHEEALHRQGILASFAWLNAQANFLGFTTYNDITYPFVTQSVITNGQTWSFYVYQLNTMLINLKDIDDSSMVNMCWGTKELKLYETVENGKVIGYNEDVLKILASFYTNIPCEPADIELAPFLSSNEKVIADFEDDEKCEWLEKEYKYIVSNRPRHYLPYETYHWEKIYKIDHKKRPMDARRRPFELFINPWDRKYDDRPARYIPRKYRPDVKRHIGRYAKDYFP